LKSGIAQEYSFSSMAIESIQSKKVAILGYGNQGRAHALNLRDRGVPVVVGARASGSAWGRATQDGFNPVDVPTAIRQSDVVMFLLPDTEIAPVFHGAAAAFENQRKWVGFAHGFAYVFGGIPRLPECEYFLAAPKGAGSVLRERFLSGKGLATAFAVAPGSSPETRALAESYARVIAGNPAFLRETTFQWETEGDLFAEQTVLVGGVWELMRNAFETLVENGHPPELAFFDVCQELSATLDLFLKNGPQGMSEKISPTALYGAVTRGPRVLPPSTRSTMQKIFEEVRSGAFASELQKEVSSGSPILQQARKGFEKTLWQKTFESLKDVL
jgi:ketol-acid reductoisomerase